MTQDTTVVEEIHRELLLAKGAVAKNDEHAAMYHLKQAHAYAIDIRGFIDHAAGDTDAAPEVRRLRDALQGALVCPPEDRGDFINRALDAVNADAGGDNDKIVDDQYCRH